MSITSYASTRVGGMTEITVASDLSGTIYYHWYQDGVYLGVTALPRMSFFLDAGEQADVVCQDTLDADYDPLDAAPDGWPARRAVWWLRSVDADVASYRVEQCVDAGDCTTIDTIDRDGEAWEYAILSDRLEDLATHEWRVIPIDVAGNDGTALELDSEIVVRRPDAPDFTVEYSAGTNRVTFTAA